MTTKKQLKKIEVITDIKSVKILERDDKRYDVQFNQWELASFIFDWENFIHSYVDEETVNKFKEEHTKPAPWDDEWEIEYIKAFNELPRKEMEITILYHPDITKEAINLIDYVNNLCN